VATRWRCARSGVLRSAGAVIDLVAEALHPEIAELHDGERLHWLGATIANDDLAGHALIVIASADAFTRDRIRSLGRETGRAGQRGR
jgi:siroheme synthase (precorrin-2 oxidase/ferrochelatase)